MVQCVSNIIRSSVNAKTRLVPVQHMQHGFR